jgi:hypothetical protein
VEEPEEEARHLPVGEELGGLLEEGLLLLHREEEEEEPKEEGQPLLLRVGEVELAELPLLVVELLEAEDFKPSSKPASSWFIQHVISSKSIKNLYLF